MAGNDAVILQSILDETKPDFGEDLADDTYFELFTANEVLRELDVSYAELEDGNVGGGGDGGLDGMYTFVNGEYVTEDFDFVSVGKNPSVQFVVTQAKRSSGFGETALDRATNTLRDLLDLEKPLDELADLYDPRFADRTSRFRAAVTALAAKHPSIHVQYAYATKGDVREIGAPVHNRAGLLKGVVVEALRHAVVDVEFLGARELLDLARTPRSYNVTVEFAEQFISTGADNYLGLVRLRDFQRVVLDGEGDLNRIVFESNVRDFQGDIAVNRDISDSLTRNDDSLDFWWLNNGVTILGSSATSAGKRVTVEDAQVVNGLQTTHALFGALAEDRDRFAADDRCVLVKIIVTDDPEARDRIIKATNFQTPVPSASLRATDRLQRNIEDYLKQNGWFYDRRKNHYKNLGKPRDRIISIANLAQALMSIAHREPDQARARPSTLIKDETQYSRLFSEDGEMELYLFCVRTQKCVDAFLAGRPDDYPATMRTNIHFHVAMVYAALLIGKMPYYPPDLSRVLSEACDETLVERAAATVSAMLGEFLDDTGWSQDRACKSRDFVTFLENGLHI